MLACQTVIQGFVMCLRRGAARHIWFVFQPDENKGYYEDIWFFWEGETGNQLLNSQRVSRSRVQEEGWGHKNFCLFSHHVHESWGWSNSVGISSLLTLWSVSQMIEQGQQIESNTFVPRGTGKFLGTFVLFSPLLLPFSGWWERCLMSNLLLPCSLCPHQW